MQDSMESNINVKAIAIELFQRYGSRKGVSHHSRELIQQYGQVEYSHIIQEVKQIQSQENSKSITSEEKARRALVQASRKKEEEKLQARFKQGARYAFIITKKMGLSENSVVKDQYGDEHPIILPRRYEVDDKISCIVRGYQIKVSKNGQVAKSNLILDMPQKIPDRISLDSFCPIPPRHYKKSPSKWASEVEGLGKHICGKPFTCSCCGQSFPARKGYRIDLKEIYFCMDCKREIFPPSGRGWRGRIISTPMGNKR